MQDAEKEAKCGMTGRQLSCGCPFSLPGCSGVPDSETETSKKIDREIAKDRKEFKRTHRVLLLGAGESGKSTFMKQMQLIHVEEFDDAVRRERRLDIRSNLLEAIVSILKAMSIINPPIQLSSSENETMAKWILDHSAMKNFSFPPEFYTYTKTLWKDTGVQAAFLRSNEFQLIDSAKYFFEKIDSISRENYLPSDQDILRCRMLTTGIYELTFYVENVKFQIIDVGGQRDERRKWFLCFNDVTSIIFVTACSSYDMFLREDFTKNRLKESLELFKIIWNNRWLGHISVIVFLNKQDLFREKILSGRSRLENYYPEYQHFAAAEIDSKEHLEVNRAKQFLKCQFERISAVGNNKTEHRCFTHFTCAIDTENIRRVFKDCRKIIQIRYLAEHSLI